MMGSLYIASTGLASHSRGMQVVGNNLANVNTVGFKQSMAYYQDLFSSTVPTQSNNITNISQSGHGAAFVDSRTIFTEGGFESSNTVTDLAINGCGYFGVVKDGQMLYTKAGNMRFDESGKLLDPTGYNLVGRKIVNGVMSSNYEPIHINLTENSPFTTHPAKATTSVSMMSYIGGVEDISTSQENNVFAMTAKWDGTINPPLSNLNYSYAEPITVYDDQGNEQTMNIYYDYVGSKNGVKLYEYVIGMAPEADGSANAGTKVAGLLMSGTMTFNSDGTMAGMTAFTPTGNDPADLGAWTLANLNGGVPEIPVTFAGSSQQRIAFNVGLKLEGGYQAGITSPDDGEFNPDLFYAASPGAVRQPGAMSAYGSIPANRFQSQDGYPEGSLRDLDVDEQGYIIGRYSNGQTQDLYRISLFRFNSQDGLRHEGQNHFSATAESGPADEGLPTDENYGSILSCHLETSNVDMSREFTHMIITQRGFQANSKIITTSDTMLQKALEIKR